MLMAVAKDKGQVEQAKATLTKDQAQAKYAQSQSKRYHELYKDGAVSKNSQLVSD